MFQCGMAIKGRGAPTNLTPTRFNLAAREADGDWLDAAVTVDGPAAKLRTTVTLEHAKTILARSANEAMMIASQLGFPVALKIDSPDISHKSDVQGVALNISNQVNDGDLVQVNMPQESQHALAK